MKPPKVVDWDVLLLHTITWIAWHFCWGTNIGMILVCRKWVILPFCKQTKALQAHHNMHASLLQKFKKIGRYFKTAWRKRCLTLCDGFGVHPSFRQNMFLAVGSQTWTMSTKNSWFYSSKLGIKASTMSWKQKDLQIDVISRYVLYVGISLAKEWVGYLHPINQKLAMYIYHM